MNGDNKIDMHALKHRIKVNETLSQGFNLNNFIFKHLKLKGNEHILDVGCGTGKQTIELAKQVPKGHVIGVDKCPDSIHYLFKKIPKNVNLFVDDMDKYFETIMPGTQFDVIFFCYSLYYTTDLHFILSKIMSDFHTPRLLKPNGKLVIVGPYGDNNNQIFDLIGHHHIEDWIIKSCTSFMTEEVIPYILRFGGHVNLHSTKTTVKFTSTEQFIEYWKNTTFYDDRVELTINHKLDMIFSKYSTFDVLKRIMYLEVR
jgi:ubiquinone/menaquinone biosynthesis C-methylase UbiE